MSLDLVDYTVKDFLDACAHIMGGVHVGNPTPKEAEILRFSWGPDGHSPVSIHVMKEIAAVVLAGLQPLTDAVAAQLNYKK